MKVQGKLKRVYPSQKFGSGFEKREFVLIIADNPDYPQHVKFEVIKDKCTLLDQFAEGQSIEVEFNLQGREWTNKNNEVVYFNTLQAWKINKAEGNEERELNSFEHEGTGLPF